MCNYITFHFLRERAHIIIENMLWYLAYTGMSREREKQTFVWSQNQAQCIIYCETSTLSTEPQPPRQKLVFRFSP